MPKSFKLKIILGGAKNSGKTSFIEGDIINDTPIGVSFKPIECYANEGDSYKFVIWDLKDRERFRFLFPLFCRGACAGLLCFDVTDKGSFYELDNWIKLFRESAGYIPIILIGTKTDLENRKVTDEEIERFIEKNNLEYVFFTSIYEEEDQREEIFKCIVEKIDKDYPLHDFSLMVPKQFDDEDFKIFLNTFDKCPICKKENHFDSLKNFYFNKNDPETIILRENLLKLKESLEHTAKIPLNKISIGIPCCSCYKKVFNEKCY